MEVSVVDMAADHQKILITSVGSRLGFNLLESLRPVRDRFGVIGVNSLAEASQNFQCDRAYLVPPTAQRAAYTARLRSIIEAERPAAVLAGRDEELNCLAALAADPAFRDVLFLTPGDEVAGICNDKYATWEFAQAHGLPFAESAVDAEGLRRIVARFGYPVVAKPRHGGYDSRGVHVVRDESEARRAFAAGRFVFQSFIEPSTASLDLGHDLVFGVPWSLQMRDLKVVGEGVVDRDGSVVCLSTVIRETAGGPSLGMTVVDDPEIERVHRAYARALAGRGHFGPLNLQGKKTAAGEFVPYEINGRFSGSVMARTLQGYNQVVYALDYFLSGRRPPPRQQAAGSPATLRVPVYFAIDPHAVKILETEGCWPAVTARAPG
jgi:hypothetical protein